MNRRSIPEEVRPLSSDVDALLSTVGQEARASAHDIRESMARVYDSARDRLSRVDESVRTTARHAAHSTDDYVHDKPWRVVAIGALAGLALGLLMSRR